jgi:iron complex transport system substrate-binding protein
MRILSLSPALTDLVLSFGLGEALVGISEGCEGPEGVVLPRIPAPTSIDAINTSWLETLRPEALLLSVPTDPRCERQDFDRGRIGVSEESIQKLSALIETPITVLNYDPYSLTEVYAMVEGLGRALGRPERGHALAGRMKAQFMDWCDNFYERMKHKRVTFLAGVDPFVLAGRWVPDLLRCASCVSQEPAAGLDDRRMEWADIVNFSPDVIVVAPRGVVLAEAMRLFKSMEQLPGWQNVPAVKRGEVIYADGNPHFYRPSMRLVDSMAILVSGVAGFESGYITPRESFYRLRWLELQRHRF